MDPLLKSKLQKQRYHIVGEHGGVKVCHWTKESLLRDRQCYKGKFYGVASHNCMQMSPVVDQCNLACSYCWREPHMDSLELSDQDPLEMLYESVKHKEGSFLDLVEIQKFQEKISRCSKS